MTPRKRTTTVPRIFTFIVVGDDQFPVDMLRFDLCYPKRETDSHEIERSYLPHRVPREHGPHRVTLISSKHPTEGRWASFGWLLESVE